MFNKFPKKTGIYHIKDNIEQLELQIYFRHINSLLKLPKFDYNKNISGEWRGREREHDHSAEGDEVKIVNIKWQEKLFSASEEELYKEAKNCISETQRKYHEWLLERAATEHNANDEQQELEKGSSRRRRKKRTKKQQQQQQQQPKTEVKVNEPKQTREIHTYVHDDNFQVNTNNKAITNCESVVHMYIFAAIDIDTELVHLQWFPQQRMLHIYPDFNDIRHNPYFIEIDKDYRHLYAYAVENISQARTTILGNELGLYLQLPEYAAKPHWRTEEERAAHFNMPPKRTRRISLLLELRDASDFDCNNSLHVRYHIELPQYTIHEEGLLEASTHSSCVSDSGIHHFGYNWQLTLLCEEEHYNAGDLLHIYFEVISIDSWQRERVEGYAHLAICLFGASEALEMYRLQCLRPVLSFWSMLERFFIGGRRKFDFRKFFGHAQRKNTDVEADNDEVDVTVDFHSRYGCQMHSTGYLQLSCQRFTQRNCELLEPCSNRPNDMTLDDIMCAYREARKRLEAVTFK